MRILITGSSGYIGSSFIKSFKDEYEYQTFSLLENTLNDLDLEKVDVVLHCAALVHQAKEDNLKRYHDVNVAYPLALAKKAKSKGVKHFIFISTVAVYGEGQPSINEDTDCFPTTPYGRSKLKAEIELQKIESSSFVVSIIRPPMVYGLNSPGNMGSLIRLVNKVHILPFGKIENERNFVYISNLVDLIDCVLEKRKSGVFLAGDDESLSTTRLIELIARGLDKKIRLISFPFFPSILKFAKPSLYESLYGNLKINNQVTKRKLDFSNQVRAEEGLRIITQGYKT